MRIPFVIFIIGVIVLFVGIVVVPATVITWQPRSAKIEGGVYHVWFPQYLVREYDVGEAKDLMLSGVASELSGKKFNFYILDLANYKNWWYRKAYTAYFEKKNITSTSFSIPLPKEQATIKVYFVVENPPPLDVNDYVSVIVSATLEWHEFTGELILGGKIAFLGIILITIAGVATFKPKAPTPSRSFVVFVSFYFFVLLASYLLTAVNQFYTLYGWLLIPAVANFFVGYLVREVDTATKIIITSFLIHAGIMFGLLNVPLVNNAFWFIQDEMYALSVIFIYYILNVPLGITASFVGGGIREYTSDIIAVCMHLVKKMKQIIGKLSRKS